MSILEPEKRLIVSESNFTPVEIKLDMLERKHTQLRKDVARANNKLRKAINDMELIISQILFEQQPRQR